MIDVIAILSLISIHRFFKLPDFIKAQLKALLQTINVLPSVLEIRFCLAKLTNEALIRLFLLKESLRDFALFYLLFLNLV